MKTFLEFLKEGWVKRSGTQYGSNPGGIHDNEETGEVAYIKTYKNPNQAKTEQLTSDLYNAMGIETLSAKRHERSSIITPWNSNLKTKNQKFYDDISSDNAEDLGKMFHGAVLTKNWDIVGLDKDNIALDHQTNKLVSLDQGGAFEFRAQGGPKNFTRDNTELRTLRDPKLPSGQVFNSAFRQHPSAEARGRDAAKSLSPDKTREIFANSGLPNWEELHQIFTSKQEAL